MLQPFQSSGRRPWDRVTLAQFRRIRRWHEAQPASHGLERRAWEAVLTAWVMGWVGWLPALEAGACWALPLCLLGVVTPRFYVYWRYRAHAAQYLRCDWLHLLD